MRWLLVDRAVPLDCYLLDLGFDGRMHVGELERWRDVWPRDLASDLVPGARPWGVTPPRARRSITTSRAMPRPARRT